MREDYGDLSLQRNNGRFSREKFLNAPVFEIDKNGNRRQRASLLMLEEELDKYPISDFETIVEALRLIAQKRGNESAQYILARCEHELAQLQKSI